MHYYQFNIGDYLSHTRHLDLLEDLAYRRLLDLYYLHERPLNSDATLVAKQIGMRDEAATVRDVLNEFFEHTEEGYVSSRIEKEIAHFRSKIEQASRAGKASAERRSNARSTDVQLTNNQEPITKKQVISQDKPAKPKRKTSIPDDFCVSKRVADWAAQKGFDRLDEHLDAFIRKAKMNAYTYMDWDLAFMEAIREDWAKLRGKQSYAQQAADIARTTVPAAKGPDPALVKIEQDRQKAAPMPAHIRQQINSVLRKA